MFKKVSMVLYKSDLLTDREIEYLREGLEQLSTSCSSKKPLCYEMEKHQMLKKLDGLSYATENAEEISEERCAWIKCGDGMRVNAKEQEEASEPANNET